MPRTRNQTRQELQSTHANLKRAAIEGHDAAPSRKRSAFGDLTNAISNNNLLIDSSKKKTLIQAQKQPPPRQPLAPKRKSRSVGGGKDSLTKTKDDLTAIPEEAGCREPESRRGGRSRSGSAETQQCSSGDSSSSAPSSTFSSAEAAPIEERREAVSQASSSSSDSEIEYHNLLTNKDLNEPPTPPLNGHADACGTKDTEKFAIGDYLPRQPGLSKSMRAILVDWMVEIQENFELNHETLYQAVKITDLFLDRAEVAKENLQLVGSTALFIACKFDERCPPCCDDFLYICDDAYTKEELFECERKVLKTLDFDIGMPMSYRYVRRYAKTSKVGMETLILARYILETSLLHYEFVSVSDSKMAAAAFLLALRMKKIGDWTTVQEKYSGYTLEEVEPLMWRLNGMLAGPLPAENTKTVLTKYQHE